MLIRNEKDKRILQLAFITGEQAVKGAIHCLLSVYGSKDNYVNPNMFDEDYLTSQVRHGTMKVFCGMSEDGAVVATLSVKRVPHFEKAFDFCGLAVHPDYRNFRLGDIITAYVLAECEKEGNSLFSANIVLFHPKAGIIYEEKGFVPTGFLLGVCDVRKHLPRRSSSSQKYSWAIYVKNGTQKEVKPLYVPEALQKFVQNIYASLGTRPEMISSIDKRGCRASRIEQEQDAYHKTLYLHVLTCGNDLGKCLDLIEGTDTDELQTTVLYLNMNDPAATWGVALLMESGYAFAGIMPLCGDDEYLIFSKIKDGIIDEAEFRMTALSECLFREVVECNGKNLD